MEIAYFLAAGFGVSLVTSLSIACCVRRRVSVLEERVAMLENRPLVYQAPAQYIPYQPIPSAPLAIPQWNGTDLERGVRIV